MKTLGLVLAMVVVLGGSAMAASVSLDILSGWNMIGAPLVPFSPDPAVCFAGAGGSLGTLTRVDAPTGGNIQYDEFDPAAFGNILLGDGYWLYGPATITYDGVPDGVPDANNVPTDMWISLPGNQFDGADAGGWHLIGQPFNHETDQSKFFFTDGTSLKTWTEAMLAGWVSGTMYHADAATGGNLSLSEDGFGDLTSFSAGQGYWVYTAKDNLAMIILAN